MKSFANATTVFLMPKVGADGDAAGVGLVLNMTDYGSVDIRYGQVSTGAEAQAVLIQFAVNVTRVDPSVSQTGYADCTSGTSCSVLLYLTTIQTGDVLLVFVPGYSASSWSVSSVSDSLGNTFTEQSGKAWSESTTYFGDYGYSAIVTSSGSADYVTVDYSASMSHTDPIVMDVTGTNLAVYSNNIGYCKSSCSSSTSLATNSTNYAGTYYLAAAAAYVDSGGAATAGTGWTSLSTGANYMKGEYDTSLSGGSTTFPFTSGSGPRSWGDEGIVVVNQVIEPILAKPSGSSPTASVQIFGPVGPYSIPPGCDTNSTSFSGNNAIYDILAFPSCTLTLWVSPGSTWYGTGPSFGVATCASGKCTEANGSEYGLTYVAQTSMPTIQGEWSWTTAPKWANDSSKSCGDSSTYCFSYQMNVDGAYSGDTNWHFLQLAIEVDAADDYANFFLQDPGIPNNNGTNICQTGLESTGSINLASATLTFNATDIGSKTYWTISSGSTVFLPQSGSSCSTSLFYKYGFQLVAVGYISGSGVTFSSDTSGTSVLTTNSSPSVNEDSDCTGYPASQQCVWASYDSTWSALVGTKETANIEIESTPTVSGDQVTSTIY